MSKEQHQKQDTAAHTDKPEKPTLWKDIGEGASALEIPRVGCLVEKGQSLVLVPSTRIATDATGAATIVPN